MSLISDWAVNTARGVGNAFTTYYNKVSKPIGRGISTGLLLTDKDNPLYKDGFQLSDVGDTYRQYAKDISPGQAFISGSSVGDILFAPIKLASKTSQLVTGKDSGPTMFQGSFDIYDAAQRKKAFSDEMSGRILSGLTDIAVTWYTDPLAKLGKGISVARGGGKIRGKQFEGVLDPKLGSKTDFGSDGWDTFLRYAVQDTTDFSKLITHRISQKSSNPELLASVLSDINVSQFNTPELIAKYGSAQEAAVEVARTVMRAATGDKAAKELIWKSPNFAKYGAQLDRATGELDLLNIQMKAVTESGGDVNAWISKNADVKLKLEKEIESLALEDPKIRNAINLTYNEILGTGASKFSSIEKRRAIRAENRSNILVQDFPAKGPNGLGMKVVSFARSEVPSGWIKTKGVDSTGSSGEIVAWMGTISAWKGVEGATKKRLLLKKYGDAADDLTRQEAVDAIEKEALRDIGEKYGLNVKLTEAEKSQFLRDLPGVSADNVKTHADVVYYTTAKKRRELIDIIKQGGKTGFVVEDQLIIPTRQLSSQLATGIPMIDAKAFERIAKQHFKNGGTSLGILSRVSTGYDMFNYIWKPSVLLRLGYTVRNVTEGSLRAMAYLGAGSEYLKYVGLSFRDTIKDVRYRHITEKALLRQASKEQGLAKNYASFAELKDMQSRSLIVARAEVNNVTTTLNTAKENLAKATLKSQKTAIKNDIKRLEVDLKNKSTIVDRMFKEAQDFDAKYARNVRVNKFSGAYNHDGLMINDAFTGDLGLYANNSSSAAKRTAVELQSQNAISKIQLDGTLTSKGFGKIDPPTYDATGKLIATPGRKKASPEYWNAAFVVHRQYRNDEVTRMLLAGNSVDEIVAAVKTNNKLRTDLLNSGQDASSAREWIARQEINVQSAFPDEALRKEMSKRELTMNEIRNTLQGRADLSPIHGEMFGLDDAKTVWQKYQEITARLFKRLGALPEDVMVRHPLYAAVYRKSMNELVDRKVAGYGKDAVRKGLSNNEFRNLEQTAHRMARKEMEATAYTINRYGGPTALMSYVSPFFAAYSNTMRTWGRLAYENPNVIGRANLIWSSPDRAGFTEKDPRSGDTWISLQLGEVLPDWLKKYTSNNTTMEFPKNSLNLMFQGEPWWSPGFGPIAQVPASAIVKNSPDINEQLSEQFGFYVPARGVLDAILPLGPTENTADIILSSQLRRMKSLMFGTKDKDYLNQLQGIYATERQRWREGKRADEPQFDEIRRKNDAMMTLRFVASLTLPFQPRFTSEYQPYIRLWNKYKADGELNGKTPAQRFYEDYPDYFTLAYSGSSATTGMDFTTSAVYTAKNNRNLVSDVYQDNPYLIQLITNNGQVESEFDQAVYVWQIKNSPVPGSKESFRGQLDPLSEVKRQDVRAGWIEYNKLSNAINAQMEATGITSLNSAEGRPLAEMKQNAMKLISDKYPEWADDRMSFTIGKWKETLTGIDKILQNEKFIGSLPEDNKPAWAVMQDYMDSRDTLMLQLAQRKEQGMSGTISSDENADLQELWDNYVTTLKRNNTQFSSWYDRFLEADPLEPIR